MPNSMTPSVCTSSWQRRSERTRSRIWSVKMSTQSISGCTFLLLLVLCSEMSLQQVPSCYRRMCDQSIMGRQLSYERALEIVNNEEYLTAADLDLVRRRGRFKRQTDQGDFPPPSQEISAIDEIETTTSALPDNTTLSTSTTTITTTSTAIPSNLLPVSVGAVALTAGVLSLGSLAYFWLAPGPSILSTSPGVAPSGVPQPGELGGGAPPVANSAIAAEALDLAPSGTVPVAIFPPFLFPRTFPAIAVIFSEPASARVIQSRSSQHLGYLGKQGHQRWKRKLKGFRYFKSCMDRFLDMVLRKRQIQERQFGFVVKVTLVDEMCQLGVTCDTNGDFLSFIANRRQSGEEFSSTAPPDCRTIFVGCSP